MSRQLMLDGGEITAEETLAIQLWYSYATANGTIQGTLDWIPGANPLYVAAQKWSQMDPADREVWFEVAATASRLLNPSD